MSSPGGTRGGRKPRFEIWALLVTAPAELRESLAGLTVGRLLDRCAAFRPAALESPAAVARHSLRLLPDTTCSCGFRTNPITRFGPIRSAVSEFSITPQVRRRELLA